MRVRVRSSESAVMPVVPVPQGPNSEWRSAMANMTPHPRAGSYSLVGFEVGLTQTQEGQWATHQTYMHSEPPLSPCRRSISYSDSLGSAPPAVGYFGCMPWGMLAY